MSNRDMSIFVRMPVAGLLAWLVPGLGHIFLGHRARGLICFVTITATFWTGVAIGGVRNTVDPQQRKLWFVAQLGTAGHTLAGYGLHLSIDSKDPQKGKHVPSSWMSAEVGLHYTGVAGLLNLLLVFDAVARADAPLRSRRSKGRAAGALP